MRTLLILALLLSIGASAVGSRLSYLRGFHEGVRVAVQEMERLAAEK